MLNLKEEIALNQFAQSVRPIEDLLISFSDLADEGKRIFLQQLSGYIWQSQPVDTDIELAIENSPLKPGFTPCVMLRTHRLVIGLRKVSELPADELNKSYILFLYLFKIAYLRRFENERTFTDKWWCSDLSNEEFVKSLLNK